ncbi:uncharacterized protein LOC128929677 isoform X2 [Callithrix jacchus]
MYLSSVYTSPRCSQQVGDSQGIQNLDSRWRCENNPGLELALCPRRACLLHQRRLTPPGTLGTTTLLPDTRCLLENSKSQMPQLLDCDKVKSSLYRCWNFIQSPLLHLVSCSGSCSTPAINTVGGSGEFSHVLTLHPKRRKRRKQGLALSFL